MTGLLHFLRHPLRLALMLLAVVALIGSAAGGVPLFAAVCGTLLALPVGELLGRSPLRTGVALGLVALLAGAGLAGAAFAVDRGASVLGPSLGLGFGDLLGYSAGAFLALAGLRILALRRPAWLAVELGTLALAFALAFAAHRGGSVARPLWLSDWAWRAGVDPGEVLLLLGGLFGVGMALLLTLESRKRLSLLAAALVGGLALLIAALVDPGQLYRPPPPAEMAEIREALGDPPLPTPPDPDRDGGAGQDPQGERPEGQDPRDGGGGEGGELPAQPPQSSEGEPARPQDQPGEGEGGRSQPQEGEGQPQEGAGQPQEGQPQEGEGQGQPQDGQPQDGQPQDGQPQDGQAEQQEQPQDGQAEQQEQPQDPPQEPNLDDPASDSGRSQPVAVVVFEDDYTPPAETYYLRQDAHSALYGSRLGPVGADGPDRDVIRAPLTRRVEPLAPAAPADRAAITGTVSLVVPHEQPFAPESPIALEPAYNPNPTRFVSTYRFTSLAMQTPYEELLDRVVGDPTWPEEVWAHYTAVPGDPRYAELAQRVLAEAEGDTGTPFRKAVAVKLWLDRNMKYSRGARHAGVPDPTADFLFGDLTGYCVHSAHAAVYLWRSLGIPSRISVGYASPEESRRGAALVVAGRDAHAWPELYLEGLGWTILDVSPAENLDPPGEPMDEDMARMLGDMAQTKPQDPERREPTDWREVARAAAQAAGLALLVALAQVLLALYAVKLWRRGVLWITPAKSASRVGYRAALDALAEVGLSRREGETREAFAARVAPQLPSFAALTERHLHVALGDPARRLHTLPEHSPRAWREALATLRAERAGAFRLRRRLLGTLNPLSFWWAR